MLFTAIDFLLIISDAFLTSFRDCNVKKHEHFYGHFAI